MNYLAHLVLAGDDEALRLGAMLGDFVRGREALATFPPDLARGIMLHRHIDAFTDGMPAVAALRKQVPAPFRRYAGIIIDLAFDHALALRWDDYADTALETFDRDVREMLTRHQTLVPDRLWRFMAYADLRGLFAAYREPAEILHSLRGIGRRLSRPNPLHRTAEIWDDFEPRAKRCFPDAFQAVQSDVADWLKSKSTTTGS
jgi:acyl carrier protein phosphodiesterase